MTSEEQKQEFEERLARMQAEININKKDQDKTFWIMIGLGVLTAFRIAALHHRIDDINTGRTLAQRDHYSIWPAK
jgi:hypothetical protein